MEVYIGHHIKINKIKELKIKEIRPLSDSLYPQLGTIGRIDKLYVLGGCYIIMGWTFNVKILSFWGIYGYYKITN